MIKLDPRPEIIDEIVDYFNSRLHDWYENAKRDYDVDGVGVATVRHSGEYLENGVAIMIITVKYIENGVNKANEFYFDAPTVGENRKSWLFDIWSEDGFDVIPVE